MISIFPEFPIPTPKKGQRMIHSLPIDMQVRNFDRNAFA